ncbi:NirD/YgiW/YdeI family stress tolerance protein [Uliginosibacterium sediminicola]|uniref:NirD/YgiW/YdeI family stress tolerance protein n=1 Tax=Uliginosibacterium sediminicola TaxID=2024550 RepID=A0ABU9YTN4_9RHOO
MKIQHIIAAGLIASSLFAASASMAQFVGPDASRSTVKQLQGSLLMDSFVTLKGHITRRLDHDLYEFNDGTGTIYLDVDDDHDHKHKRGFLYAGFNAPIDQNTPVEIYGKYVPKVLGFSKIKLIDMRVVK